MDQQSRDRALSHGLARAVAQNLTNQLIEHSVICTTEPSSHFNLGLTLSERERYAVITVIRHGG